MKYVQYDSVSGTLNAFYLAGDTMPSVNILQLTDVEYDAILSSQGASSAWRVINGVLTNVGLNYGVTLTTTKDQAITSVNLIVEKARAKYITILDGQDDIYREKITEAIEHAAAGYPLSLTNYPFLNAEVLATGLTPQQVSDNIIAARAVWTSKMAAIELIRRKVKIDITNALSTTDIDNIKAQALIDLNNV